jgi:hypothetical protein
MPIHVGSVSVDVVPSTKKFWSTFKADTKPGGSKAGDELGKLIGDRIAVQMRKSLPLGIAEGARSAGPQGKRAGEEFGGKFASSVQSRISAALKALPKARITGDTSDVDIKLKSLRTDLERLGDKRIGIDIDERLALAKLDRIERDLTKLGNTKASPSIEMNALGAAAALHGVQGQADKLDRTKVTIKVDADTAGAAAGLAAMEAGSAGSIGSMSTLIAVGAAIGPALIPVAEASAGALAAVGTGAIAGAAGIGVLVLAFSGVADSVKALGTARDAAADEGVAAAKRDLAASSAVAGAQEQIRAAVVGVATARAAAGESAVRSSEAVRNATRSLSAAQADARRVEATLTQARVDAQRAMEDLNAQVRGGALDQRQATLDAARAQADLTKTLADPAATALERQQAQLTFDQAQQRIADLGVSQKRLTAQKAASDKAGIRGSTQVTGAMRNIAEAQEKVQAAERHVADARRASATAARQSAASVASAQARVANGQRALTKATTDTGTAGTASGKALAKAMASQSAAGVTFAVFLDGLRDKFKGIKAAAQGGLLPGAQDAIKTLLPFIPKFSKFIGELATTIGSLFRMAAKTFTSPFWLSFFRYIASTAGPILRQMTTFILDVAQGFAGLLMAFAPVTQQVGGGLASLGKSFADFGANATKSEGFQRFLENVKQSGPLVWNTLVKLGAALMHVLDALRPIGVFALAVASGLAAMLTAIPTDVLLAIVAGMVALVFAYQVAAPAVETLSAAMEILTSAQVAFNIAAALNPVGIVVAAVAASIAIFVAQFTLAWQSSEKFRDTVTETWRLVQEVTGMAVEVINDWFKELGITSTSVMDLFTSSLRAEAEGAKIIMASIKATMSGTTTEIELANQRAITSQQKVKEATGKLKDAQAGLVKTVRDELQARRDLDDQIKGSELSKRGADLGLRQAKQSFADTNKRTAGDKSPAAQLERDQAKLAVDQAAQSVVDANKSLAEEKAKKAALPAGGVKAAPAVVAARGQVEAAAKAKVKADADAETAAQAVVVAKTRKTATEQKSILGGLGATFMWLWKNIVIPVWNGICTAVTWAWHNVLKPALNNLNWLVTKVIAPAFLWFWEHVVRPVWSNIKVAISIAWTIIKVVLGLLYTYIKYVVAPLFTWFWEERIKPVWKAITDAISFAWEKRIKPVFLALSTFVVDKVVPVFKKGVALIGSIWDGLVALVRKPVEFIVNTIINKGIVDTYNDIVTLFPGAKKIDHVTLPGDWSKPAAPKKAPGGGGGGAFAAGGAVFGAGTGTSDSVPAWLSTGEHVWTAREVQRAGGHQAVEAIRGAVLDGYATGGQVAAAQKFVRDQVGKPYGWNNAGPDSYDCSGIVSAAYNVLNGKKPYGHTFSSSSLPGRFLQPGPGQLTVGYAHPGQKGASSGVGHVAGNLEGMAFESTGGVGVRINKATPVANFAHIGHVGTAGQFGGFKGVGTVVADEGSSDMNPLSSLVGIVERLVKSNKDNSPFAKVAGQMPIKAAKDFVGGATEELLRFVPGVGLAQDAWNWATGDGEGKAKDSKFDLPGDVTRWTSTVLRVLKELGQPDGNLGAVLRRINFESSGNPKSINDYDSNARAGHPSQGLMQTIPSTFAAHAGKYRSLGITDPLANIYAGLHYAIGRYGSINAIDPLVRPSGYDNGGYLPPGLSTVFNGTGKPEAVFTDGQLQDMKANRDGHMTLRVVVDDGKVSGLVRVEVDEAFGSLADAHVYGTERV